MTDPLTEDDVRRIVGKMLGIDPEHERIGWCSYRGAVSKKALGELVADVGERHRFVVIDLREVRTIAGRKPWWRP